MNRNGGFYIYLNLGLLEFHSMVVNSFIIRRFVRSCQECLIRRLALKPKVEDDILISVEGELECSNVDLKESNKNLAALKAETNAAAKGGVFPVLLGNKRVANDRAREKEKNLNDMESLLKELQKENKRFL